jgi:hypothetical protein
MLEAECLAPRLPACHPPASRAERLRAAACSPFGANETIDRKSVD